MVNMSGKIVSLMDRNGQEKCLIFTIVGETSYDYANNGIDFHQGNYKYMDNNLVGVIYALEKTIYC